MILMRRILLLLSLLLVLAAPALATDITVNSFPVPNYRWGGTTAKVRLYSNMAWTDSTGVPHIVGTPGNQTGFYQEINCTVTGSTLYIPQFVLPSTIDSIDHNQVRITAVIFDYRGNAHEQLFANWRIPNQPATTTWPVLVVYNASTQPPLAPNYATLTQVSAMIVSAINASTAAATTRFAPGDTANACSPRDVFFRDADGHYYGCPTSNNPAQFLLAGDPIDPNNITNQTAISGVVTPEQYGAIHDGTSHPLSGRYATLALAQAAYGGAYSFVTSLAQEIDYAAVKAASNTALGADTVVTGAFQPIDSSSTVTSIVDSSASFEVDALAGKVLTLRYYNGFTDSRVVVSNTATTISVSAFSFDFHACTGETCLAACALPPQTFDCIAYTLSTQGEHGYANAKLNKPVFLPAGTYIFGNDTWLIRNASGIHIYGAGRTATKIQSNTTVFATDGLWYSQLGGIEFDKLTTAAVPTVDIDGNVPGHPYTTRSVQGNKFSDLLVDGGGGTGTNAAFHMCRMGLSGAQCSEDVFIQNHFQNNERAVAIEGFNALNNIFIGNNFQNYLTGAFFNGGSAAFYKTAWQCTRGYAQIAAGGADIDASTAGVNDTIIDDGSDSESLVHYKGGLSQIAYIRGLVQRCGSCYAWTANAVVALNLGLQSAVTGGLYRVTTAGTSTSSLPVFSGATVTDGTAVWTLVDFNNNTVPAGYLDGTSGLRGPGTLRAAVRSDIRSVEVTGLSTYAVPMGVEHVLVNAAASNVVITLPTRSYSGGDTFGARVTVSQYNGVSQSGHTVTVTAAIGIEGGDFTLLGTGGGYATFTASGGGDLTQRYYRVAQTPSSDAATLNGTTFAAPGPIGGGTPGAITGTTITANTSLVINGGTALATTNRTGTGNLVLATNPTITPASVTITNGAALVEGRLSTVSGVDMNTATPTILYTCPAARTCVITRVVVRSASTSLTTASYSLGWTSAAYSDVIGNATHTELTGATLYTILTAKTGATIGNSTDTFRVLMNTLQGGAATTTIDVYGMTF